jgi:hypothetical protein
MTDEVRIRLDAERGALMRGLGLTTEETEALVLLTVAASRILALPVLHPMERTEAAGFVHALQSAVLARPAMRAFGWPEPGEGT